LAAVANGWQWLAVLWHVYFAVVLVLMLYARLSVRMLGVLFSGPLLSVGCLALYVGNPFNAAVFVMSAVVLLMSAPRLPRTTVRLAPMSSVIPGAIGYVFGWIYPHFLNTSSFVPYLYAAPTGLIPCPTLSIIVGLTLLAGGLSRTWSFVLASLAASYGIFGVLVLGVSIDLVLAAAAATLFAVALQFSTRERPRAV